MIIQVHQRVYNFHGQPCARLNRDQSVYCNDWKPRSFLMTMLSPVLFCAPDVHLRGLEKIWVDGVMHSTAWGLFMGKLNTEWQEFTLYVSLSCCVSHQWAEYNHVLGNCPFERKCCFS